MAGAYAAPLDMHKPDPLDLAHPPADIGWAEFDLLLDTLPAWQAAITALAATMSPHPVRQMATGSVLVALLGDEQVLKLYPPFLRDHFEFERAALRHLGAWAAEGKSLTTFAAPER